MKHQLFILIAFILIMISCESDLSKLIDNAKDNQLLVDNTKGMLILGGDTLHYLYKDSVYYIQDDLYLTSTQFNRLLSRRDTVKKTRGLTLNDFSDLWPTDLYGLWPKGKIPYTFHSNLRDPSRVTTAISMINSQTDIMLVPRTNEKDFVEFQSVSGTTSSSALGRAGSKQLIKITDGANFGTVIHEIFHAAGLQHEHQRKDASQHIRINLENIQTSYRDQYTNRSGHLIGTYNVNSIMHYGSFSLAAIDTSRPVIERILPNGQTTTFVANRDSITYTDKLALKYLYAGSDIRYLKTKYLETVVFEEYTSGSTEYYNARHYYKVTFHSLPESTELFPTNRFMRIRINYTVKCYGAGPFNLHTYPSYRTILVYPGVEEVEFYLDVLDHNYQGYYQPGTYIEVFNNASVTSLF